MNSQSFKHLVRSKAEWGGRMDLNIWCHSLQNSLHAQTLTLCLSRIRSTAVDLSVGVVTAAASSAANCCFVIQSKKKKNLSSSKSFFFSFTISAKIFQQLQQESKFWWSLLWKNFTSPSHGLRIQRSRRNSETFSAAGVPDSSSLSETGFRSCQKGISRQYFCCKHRSMLCKVAQYLWRFLRNGEWHFLSIVEE